MDPRRNLYLPNLPRNQVNYNVVTTQSLLKQGRDRVIPESDGLKDDVSLANNLSLSGIAVKCSNDDSDNESDSSTISTSSTKPPKTNFHYAREIRVGANGERSKKLQTATEFYIVNYNPCLQVQEAR